MKATILSFISEVRILMYETRKGTLPSGWQRTVVILTWSSSWFTPVLMWMQPTTERSPRSWLLFARCAVEEETRELLCPAAL